MELITPYRDSGIVLDIGTGDGRFVSTFARRNPDKFFIGIDANAKPLAKLSIKITRKTIKGGLPNSMFVQAAVEDLPEEFHGIASEIYINFPWGSLLCAVATGDERIFASLYRIAASDARLTVTIGVDPVRDRTELERLRIPQLDMQYFRGSLLPRYDAAGFRIVELSELAEADWSRIETSWARKLGGNTSRIVFRLSFVRF